MSKPKTLPTPSALVVSRDGKQVGRVIGCLQVCPLEGCRGYRMQVRWPDGRLTRPCTKGMRQEEDVLVWRIDS